jgi:oligopeptide/dipeptide ABC transporter ATP-binding protein
MNGQELRKIRGKEIGYIFQEPGSSLNPVVTVGDQIAEAIRLHGASRNPREEVVELMKTVGLPDPARRMKSYPHEMSGGMQQRAMIAMALASRPGLLVADEPTTALDVTIQAQILELMKELQSRMGMAILLITHNLGLVAEMAHYIYVMYAGRMVETGTAGEVLRSPSHPYTKGLISAVPNLESWPGKGRKIGGIQGSVPDASALPPACKFEPRCTRAQDPCRRTEPDLESKGNGRKVRCYFPFT